MKKIQIQVLADADGTWNLFENISDSEPIAIGYIPFMAPFEKVFIRQCKMIADGKSSNCNWLLNGGRLRTLEMPKDVFESIKSLKPKGDKEYGIYINRALGLARIASQIPGKLPARYGGYILHARERTKEKALKKKDKWDDYFRRIRG